MRDANARLNRRFADTVGRATREEIEIAADYAREYSLTSAAPSHPKEKKTKHLSESSMVFLGITQFDPVSGTRWLSIRW